ncbi:MAG: hypothetical protein ABI177_08755 [Edaphobacter sp.]
MDCDCVGAAEVIGEGQRALPAVGRLGAFERPKNRLSIFIGERVGGDGGQVDGIFGALRVGKVGR